MKSLRWAIAVSTALSLAGLRFISPAPASAADNASRAGIRATVPLRSAAEIEPLCKKWIFERNKNAVSLVDGHYYSPAFGLVTRKIENKTTICLGTLGDRGDDCVHFYYHNTIYLKLENGSTAKYTEIYDYDMRNDTFKGIHLEFDKKYLLIVDIGRMLRN